MKPENETWNFLFSIQKKRNLLCNRQGPAETSLFEKWKMILFNKFTWSCIRAICTPYYNHSANNFVFWRSCDSIFSRLKLIKKSTFLINTNVYITDKYRFHLFHSTHLFMKFCRNIIMSSLNKTNHQLISWLSNHIFQYLLKFNLILFPTFVHSFRVCFCLLICCSFDTIVESETSFFHVEMY